METATQRLHRLTSYDPGRDWDVPIDDPWVIQDLETNDLDRLPWFVKRYPADLPRVDNNAHLGGFICGLLLGFLLFPRMTSGRSSYRARQVWVFGCAALFLVLVGYALASFTRPLGG